MNDIDGQKRSNWGEQRDKDSAKSINNLDRKDDNDHYIEDFEKDAPVQQYTRDEIGISKLGREAANVETQKAFHNVVPDDIVNWHSKYQESKVEYEVDVDDPKA